MWKLSGKYDYKQFRIINRVDLKVIVHVNGNVNKSRAAFLQSQSNLCAFLPFYNQIFHIQIFKTKKLSSLKASHLNITN